MIVTCSECKGTEEYDRGQSLGIYGYRCHTCQDKIDERFEHERALRECPLYDDEDNKCHKLDGNKDMDKLRGHLLWGHPQIHLSRFIAEGVEDDWD